MFLHHLSERQKQSLLALATRMVLADGQITDREEEMLLRVKTYIGPDVVAPANEIYGVTNASVFDSNEARVATIVELLLLGHSDEHFHANEDMVLNEVLESFELTLTDLEEIESWVSQMLDLERDFSAFIASKLRS